MVRNVKDTKLNKNIGKRLRMLRVDKELLLKDVCKKINVSLMTLFNYEKGITNITIKNLLTLADYYNVSINYLIFGDDNLKSFKENTINGENKWTL